jgi:hypothetical protein
LANLELGESKVLGSVADFLQFVDEARCEWAKKSKDPLRDDEELWFRGENSNYTAPLHPQLYRFADGNPATDSISKLLRLEDQYCEDFKKWAFQFCENPPDDDWEWYFLMQHHGVPTRLLDWSDGALVALHFAVYRNAQNTGTPRVYVLDPTWLNDFLDEQDSYEEAKKNWRNVKEHNDMKGEWDRTYIFDEEDGWKKTPLPNDPLVLDFYNITRRIAAQRSRFVAMGRERGWFARLLKQKSARLRYVDFERDRIPQIKRQLADAGITESVIFPDLDGVGREINQRWKDRQKPRNRVKP